MRVQHIILASQMINLGFLVGLFTYNARLAKSHVVMSCKLFCHWLVWFLAYKFVIPFNNFFKMVCVYTHSTRWSDNPKVVQRQFTDLKSPDVVGPPNGEAQGIRIFVQKHTASSGQTAIRLSSVSLRTWESFQLNMTHFSMCHTLPVVVKIHFASSY